MITISRFLLMKLGPKNERNRIKEEELSDLSEFDIVVTTYEILVSEVNFFRRKYVWTAVIVDEGHRLKNERSQFSEKLRLIACLSKVILSGTPLQNNLKELWAMLYYLAPDVFQSSKPFEEGFDLAKGHIDSRVLRKARKLLSVFMLRRLKEVSLVYSEERMDNIKVANVCILTVIRSHFHHLARGNQASESPRADSVGATHPTAARAVQAVSVQLRLQHTRSGDARRAGNEQLRQPQQLSWFLLHLFGCRDDHNYRSFSKQFLQFQLFESDALCCCFSDYGGHQWCGRRQRLAQIDEPVAPTAQDLQPHVLVARHRP